MHEVVFSPSTAQAVEAAKLAGRCTWRISSTLFAHVASDRVLKPLGHFASPMVSRISGGFSWQLQLTPSAGRTKISPYSCRLTSGARTGSVAAESSFFAGILIGFLVAQAFLSSQDLV